MKPNKKRLTCPGTDTQDVPTQDAGSASSMTKKELEELMYDTAVVMLKGMSPGSVFQFAVDRQLQLLSNYGPQELKKLQDQYKMYEPATKKDKTSGGGF